MAKSITVRFYRVGKMAEHGPSLRQALQAIIDLGEPAAREGQLTGGFICRLERLHLTPGYVAGEMVRIRVTDLPCEVHPDGTRVLGVDVPIGDGIAFCFREEDDTLAIHYDPRVVSPGRFTDYIGQKHHPGQFVLAPLVDAGALARFRAQPLRKLRVKLARPDNLGELAGPLATMGDAFRAMGEGYEAPVITIEMSMGHAKGALSEMAKAAVEGMLHLANISDDVRGVFVTPDAGEGMQNEDINLLDSLLSEKGEIGPASEEPDVVYASTSSFVRLKLDEHG